MGSPSGRWIYDSGAQQGEGEPEVQGAATAFPMHVHQGTLSSEASRMVSFEDLPHQSLNKDSLQFPAFPQTRL